MTNTKLAKIENNILRPEQLRTMLNNPLVSVPDVIVDKCVEKFLNEYNKDARSNSTHKALQTHWKGFVTFCTTNGEKSLPASAQTVSAYLKSRQKDGIHRNTIAQDLYAINRMHKIAGLPLPRTDNLVVDTMGAIVRTNVKNGEKIKQAKGMNWGDVRDGIITMLESDRVIDIRDASVLSVAYSGLMRSSEVRNIQIKHVQFLDNGCVRIEIPTSKSNQTGESEYKVLAQFAADAIKKYLSVREDVKNVEEFLFNSVSRYNKTTKHKTALSPKTINDLFKRLDSELTSHSARVGGAQDLHNANVDIAHIMVAGGWTKQENAVRYFKGAEKSETPMTNIMN